MRILPLFACPVIQIQLDLDTDKLTEFSFQLQNRRHEREEKHSNKGGWQSNDINKDKHEEFVKLKKEITRHLQVYHSEVFRGMKFKGNVNQKLQNMWININEKYHYNDWHVHPYSTLSGTYYIKHDGSTENGDILFKHPAGPYMSMCHWPMDLIESYNDISAAAFNILPKTNLLLIFPSWLEHKVEANLKNDTRISLSFNTVIEEKERKT
jgi:uncharacterized protein (TIGR02466 family)